MTVTQRFVPYTQHKQSIRFTPAPLPPGEVPLATSIYVDRKYVTATTREITVTLTTSEA